MRKTGFTLIELSIVLGLMTVVAGFSILSLNRTQNTANNQSAVETIITDLKNQQIKAMAGDTQNTSIVSPFGIYLSNNFYTLFQGSGYDPNNSSNKKINLNDTINLSANFPSPQIVFTPLNGEIVNYQNNSQITVTNSANNESKVININRLGVVSVQ